MTETESSYRLFVSVAGRNTDRRQYPQHTWLALLEDPSGQIVWSNSDDKPEGIDGSQSDTLHSAIRAAVEYIPDGATVLLFAPQRLVHDIYHVSRERRRQERYRGSNKKERPQAGAIRAIDDETERRGIILIGRLPELHQEYDRLEEVRLGAAERWQNIPVAAVNEF
ncbi:hypothetical protein ACXHMN_04585 [Rhizobium sp. LEGMi12c]